MRRLLRGLLAATLAMATAMVTALPASALSCLRPDAVRLYTEARDAEARFRVIHGQLEALEPLRELSGGLGRKGPAELELRAQVSGQQLGARGFKAPVEALPVTVRLVCFASWCGSFPEGETLLMALEEEAEGRLVLVADPCFSRVIADPEPAALRAVTRCHQSGDCPTGTP